MEPEENVMNAAELRDIGITNEIHFIAPLSEEQTMVDEYTKDDVEKGADYKTRKYVALYKARMILKSAGTMQERQIAGRQLHRMKKFSLNSV